MAQGIVSFSAEESEAEIEELIDSGYEIVSLAPILTSEGNKVLVIYEYDLEDDEEETDETSPHNDMRV